MKDRKLVTHKKAKVEKEITPKESLAEELRDYNVVYCRWKGTDWEAIYLKGGEEEVSHQIPQRLVDRVQIGEYIITVTKIGEE